MLHPFDLILLFLKIVTFCLTPQKSSIRFSFIESPFYEIVRVYYILSKQYYVIPLVQEGERETHFLSPIPAAMS